jgi:hypothetical protein
MGHLGRNKRKENIQLLLKEYNNYIEDPTGF